MVHCQHSSLFSSHSLFLRYKFYDPGLKSLIDNVDSMFTVISGGFPEDRIPGYKYLWESRRMKRMKQLYDNVLHFVRDSFQEHCKSFKRGM